ncbi:MAG: ABC-type transport system involved in multi-copper enzyme maturation permease subunit [Myxococcota bacterium]|jgi:ABC-type transport system involved in multi-copper enzyme maturation permease subunit
MMAPLGLFAGLGRILAVAENTRREAFRNRAFVVMVILGIGLNVAGWALAKLAVSTQAPRVVQNFGYFSVSILTVITAILMGVILLYKELDKKTIFTLIPKPVMRFEIVLGKFVGLSTLLAGLVLFLGLGWHLAISWHGALEVAGRSIVPDLYKSLVLIWLEAVTITGVALLFSGWTRPFLSGVFTFGYFLMGRLVYMLNEHLSASKGVLAEPGALRDLVMGVTYLVPDLQIFNVSRELALGIDVPGAYLLAATGYAASFTAVFLVLGIALFSRRDFI